MKMIEKSQKVDFNQLESLAKRCFDYVQFEFPDQWESKIIDFYSYELSRYLKASQVDIWQAGADLYNAYWVKTDKMFILATVYFFHLEPQKLPI